MHLPLPLPEIAQRYQRACDATRAAGNIALKYFHDHLTVEWKEDESPVTVADRAAEKALREQLKRFFPNDGFFGEEYGEESGSSPFRWIIDPIDGTRCFIRGIPHWGTLVGLEYLGQIVASICYAPAMGEFYRAMIGEGAWLNDARIAVSQEKELSRSLMCYTGVKIFRNYQVGDAFERVLAQVEGARGYGDYYGFMLVARGSCDLLVDFGLHAWDIAGLQMIVTEAGGKLTDWSGGIDLFRPDVVASNGHLHAEVLQLLDYQKSNA
ncbi:MAG: inositol monophosphatase family protein [Zavarzinella sp.]